MATILIIDDDDSIRALGRKALELDGHRVVDACDGDIGLQRFADDPADLVVVDLFMPNKGGWETIGDLQKAAPGVPFVIVSGGGALELVRAGERGTLRSVRGIVPYEILRKPFSVRSLRATVTELLNQSAPCARRSA
jgi:DNA-binding NtrC family response regulator